MADDVHIDRAALAELWHQLGVTVGYSELQTSFGYTAEPWQLIDDGMARVLYAPQRADWRTRGAWVSVHRDAIVDLAAWQ